MNEFSPPRTARILIIDDSREMLDHLGMMLAPHYELSQAASGEAGLAMALERLPDLILLDVCMDGMDGYAVCERLKQQASTRHIPVVLMSAYIDTEGEARAFEVGASDCLRKPINERIAASRIQVQLSLKAAQDLNRDREAALEQEVRRRTEHIELTQHVALLALVNLARTRDTETGGHIVRTQAYVRMLAERLREHPRFSAELTPNAIRLMTQSAPLHDIGKIGIPDHILRKPGALSRAQASGSAAMGLLFCQRAMRSLRGDLRIALTPDGETAALLRFGLSVPDSEVQRKRDLALRLSP